MYICMIEDYEVIKSHVIEEYFKTCKMFALSENKRLKHRL